MKIYENYVSEINEIISSVKSSSKRVFELLKESRSELSTDDYNKLKKEINVDKSTINKMEKIFDSDVVMNNIENLPVSWGTLHLMTLVDPDELQSFIDEGKIDSKTTLSEVKKLRGEIKTSTPKVEDEVSSSDTDEEDEVSSSDIDDDEEYSSSNSDVVISLVMKNPLTSDQLKKEIETFISRISDEVFDIEVNYGNDIIYRDVSDGLRKVA